MEALRDVLADLWHERRGLGAVLFGLCWGTLGLTVLLGFGAGMHESMDAVVRRSSDRMLRYWAGATTRPYQGLPAGRRIVPQPRDVEALRGLPGVAAVSPELRRGVTVRHGARRANVNARGVDATYARIRGMNIRPGGRFLSAADVAERRRVACLGAALARELFGGRDPVGGTVRIGDTPLRVVGVVADRVTVMSYDGEDAWKLFLPHTTAGAVLGRRLPGYVLVQVTEPARHRGVDAAVRARLAPRLGFDPDDRPALGFNDHVAVAGEIRGILLGTRVFLGVVGLLGLMVAALGVGNAQYARVEERRREIGLLRALGATRRAVLGRQLLEACVVTSLGGLVGLLLAVAVLAGLDALPFDAEAKAYLGSPVPSVRTSLGIVVLLGLAALVAGLQPARAAASITPVEALRHD